MKYLYSYYNVLGGFHGDVFCAEHSPKEFLTLFVQSLYGADIKTLESLKEDDLFYLGEYDNVSGSIVPVHDFVAHLGDIVSSIILKKKGHTEGEDHGKEIN